MNEAAIALGSNLGDSRATLDRAVEMIDRRVGKVIARSRWMETEALVHPDDPVREHPPFLNGVVIASVEGSAGDVLAMLLKIERGLGRTRDPSARPWQPRVIDLDLIYLGQEVRSGPGLSLPHPRMHERQFVLLPLLEVRPGWRHPVSGRTIADLVADAAASDDPSLFVNDM